MSTGAKVSIEAVDTRARGLGARRREESSGAVAMLRSVDWILLGAVIALVGYGLWAIDGITRHDAAGSQLSRQATYVAVGAVLLVATTFIDPAFYRRFSNVIYGGTIALMVLVLVSGAALRGSKRWIDIGFFSFQPSEFGKVLFTLFLAAFVAERAKRLYELRAPLATIGMAAVPVVLVFLQPDIGTALVYAASLAAVLFIGGVRWAHLAIIGAAALVAVLAVLWILPAAGISVLKPYQAARLTGFTHPDADPQGATYNINQSIIAVGSGGLRGRGVDGATQTGLDYLPEHATDFAFASLAEQRGFFGAALLLGLYLLVVWRGLKIVANASDLFSAAAAGGLVVAFLFQVFVNVGMTIGVAPITGIPLPFVSVGGSAMIANLTAMGILLGICARSRRRRS